MQVSIQTDKRKKPQPVVVQPDSESESEDDDYTNYEQRQRDRKIRKLTQVNRELIEKLKQQNEDLTKKINKQKNRPGRSLSVKSSPKSGKETEKTRKELSNAYKQIDMYKSMLTNLKAKEVSVDTVQKINQLENKIKQEETAIEDLQKEIKYLGTIKEQQEKDLKIFQNDGIRNSVVELEKEVNALKDKIKASKKNGQRRDEIEKKQHAYQIELERALRKLNDEYYPGKAEDKKAAAEELKQQVTENDWQNTKNKLIELRKTHQDYQKRIQNVIRQKNKELKSAQENELKIKQKNRKLQTLRNKLVELSKLATTRDSAIERKGLKEEAPLGQNEKISVKTEEKVVVHQKQKQEIKVEEEREIKKWNIPQGYCLQKGKILPESIFFSDKTFLKNAKKTKITQINIWHNREAPCMFQFIYQNENGEEIEGIQPVPNATSYEQVVFKMKEGDYLDKIKGYFLQGELVGIQFISKFGKEINIETENAKSQGQFFSFEPKPNEIPSCFFGAYVRNGLDEVRICHIGLEFITNW